MSATPRDCRVTILVKALPQRSPTHGETVCCAGVTAQGEFKRLYPVRFRHLKEGSSFSRWDNVDFKYVAPTRDSRRESCRVFEDTISIGKPLSAKPTVRASSTRWCRPRSRPPMSVGTPSPNPAAEASLLPQGEDRRPDGGGAKLL